ncbi:MAG: TonB-dependent receptor, partial [Gemmatimonadetes bacterium]|nr:TonB-dependent receptor [Gemmatimonadota bacterium]
MDARLRSFLLAAAWVALPGAPAAAQQGAIAGRVTNATTLEPVPVATIRVVGGGLPTHVTSESDGSFELRLPEGVYDLVVEVGGFAPKRFDRVRVRGGLTTTKNLPLESRGYRLAGFIVTASRKTLGAGVRAPGASRAASRGAPDTEITAPSSSHSVSGAEIAGRPAPSPVEHLREVPGVDIGTQGIQASNVVVRGFNNIFSGALHLLTDYRLAGLPALRVNLLHMLPLNALDIERVEVILGPGSALYGPNTANGVVHLITKSPLESPGTTVSVGVGERSILQGAFRSVLPVSEEFALKLSGQLLHGQEWPYVDSRELEAKQAASADLDACTGDREARGVTAGQAEIACRRTGDRDYRIRRYGLEARADWRYSPRGTLVGTYGVTDASGIELTGLGAARTDRWLYQFIQGRFTY